MKFRRHGGIEAAMKMRDMLHEKFFDDRQIQVHYVPEAIFNKKVSEAI